MMLEEQIPIIYNTPTEKLKYHRFRLLEYERVPHDFDD